MALLEHLIKKIMDKGEIVAKEKLTQSAYKITIRSEAVRTMDFVPGCFIRLGVGIGKQLHSKKDMARSYSIWDIDREHNIFSLAIATHSKGIGAQWAKNCKVGDTVYYKTKTGTFTVDHTADRYLLIGDLSALSHLYVIHRSLSDDKQVESIIYNHDVTELYPDIDHTTPLNFYAIDENNPQAIIAEIEKRMPTLKGAKMAYIAGDSPGVPCPQQIPAQRT